MIEMKVPSPGESITEVQISSWLKKDGDFVEKDEELCEIDSDKATLTLNAEVSGTLKINVKEGETVTVGSVVCTIDEALINRNSKQTDSYREQSPENKKKETVKDVTLSGVEAPKQETTKSYA